MQKSISHLEAEMWRGEFGPLGARWACLVSDLTRFRDGLATGEITAAPGEFERRSCFEWELIESECWAAINLPDEEEYPLAERRAEIAGLLPRVPGLTAAVLTEFIEVRLPSMRDEALESLRTLIPIIARMEHAFGPNWAELEISEEERRKVVGSVESIRLATAA